MRGRTRFDNAKLVFLDRKEHGISRGKIRPCGGEKRAVRRLGLGTQETEKLWSLS